MAALLAATVAVAIRVPQYRAEAAMLDGRMTDVERATRNRILQSETRRSELAVALLQREMRTRALREKNLHLALSVRDSTLALRHGPATLRTIPVLIGSDSVVRAPDGRSWRFVRALGERHLREKQLAPTYLVPEWVYVARGEPVPPEAERRVPGGLGEYVLRLGDGTEIYSTPRLGPHAGAAKPASFMAAEEDLRAIFDAVGVETPVYVY